MKNFKKIVLMVTVISMIASVGAVFADVALKTPAEIAAELTGKTVEELYKERTTGKTYGTIANDAGKLDEFKAQILEQKKAILDQNVKDGKLTQAQADEIYNAIKDNQTTCDGTGSAAIGRNNGVCFGQGNGMGRGLGVGRGMGMMRGLGNFGGVGTGRGLNWQ